MNRFSLNALIAISLYVMFGLISNILSVKILVLPLVALAVDGGTLLYPFTFTVRDFVHKTIGRKLTKKLIIITGALNLLMVGAFLLVGIMEPDPTWFNQAAYESILMPVWRITLASIFTAVVSEFIDTAVFSRIIKKFNNDVLAVLASNFVALVVDSILFTLLAFYGTMPMSIVLQIMLANLIIKFIMSLLSSPAIKLFKWEVDKDMR